MKPILYVSINVNTNLTTSYNKKTKLTRKAFDQLKKVMVTHINKMIQLFLTL